MNETIGSVLTDKVLDLKADAAHRVLMRVASHLGTGHALMRADLHRYIDEAHQ